jgi:2-hydroxychromene-2-carboxylate isomerase
MAGKTLEFFFDLGSPYSYLASTRVEALAQRAGATLRWRPFLVGAVFKTTGNVAPAFNLFKARYLLKDLGDWTRSYKLPDLVLPANFPVDTLKANRLALVAQEQGRLPQWTCAVFEAAFVRGQDISAPGVLAELLRGLDIDPQQAFARMLSQQIKDALRQNTDEAVSRGAFGAPTFFVGEDMYFGNDRLDFVEAALKSG